VLSHEQAHVAHGDFFCAAAGGVNRAVFWFNPLAWWQLVRMAELAEIISDDAALEMLNDPPSYAGILLDFAGLEEPAVARPWRGPVRCASGWSESFRDGRAGSLGLAKARAVRLRLRRWVMFSAGAVVPGGAPASHADTVEAEPHPFDR